MDVTVFKWIAIASLFTLAFSSGLLPLYTRRSASPSDSSAESGAVERRNARLLSLGNMFSGGVFLGGGLLHLLPEANEALAPIQATWPASTMSHYPLAFLFCAAGFFAILLIEEFVLDRLVNKRPSRRSQSGEEAALDQKGRASGALNNVSKPNKSPDTDWSSGFRPQVLYYRKRDLAKHIISGLTPRATLIPIEHFSDRVRHIGAGVSTRDRSLTAMQVGKEVVDVEIEPPGENMMHGTLVSAAGLLSAAPTPIVTYVRHGLYSQSPLIRPRARTADDQPSVGSAPYLPSLQHADNAAPVAIASTPNVELPPPLLLVINPPNSEISAKLECGNYHNSSSLSKHLLGNVTYDGPGAERKRHMERMQHETVREEKQERAAPPAYTDHSSSSAKRPTTTTKVSHPESRRSVSSYPSLVGAPPSFLHEHDHKQSGDSTVNLHLSGIPTSNAADPNERLLYKTSYESDGLKSNGEDHHEHDHEHIHVDAQGSALIAYVLVLALSFHSVFEGLSLGMQSTLSTTVSIFVVIAAHSPLAAFALSVSLLKARSNLRMFLICLLIFASMTPLGAILGLVLSQTLQGNTLALTGGVAQSFSAGTFLFVAIVEVIPKELAVHVDKGKKLALALLGFSLMGIIKLFDN